MNVVIQPLLALLLLGSATPSAPPAPVAQPSPPVPYEILKHSAPSAKPSSKPRPKASPKPVSRSKTRLVLKVKAKPSPKPKQSLPTGSVGEYQAWAKARVSASQWPCLRELWDRESGWDPTSDNPTSSAYGIPQIIGMKPGTGWKRQIERGLSYIDHRYGTPCSALAAHDSKGWY